MKTDLRYQENTLLHPMSYKALKNGHYWITKDSFSDKFDRTCDLLWTTDKNKAPMTLLHDPEHPKVKARLWKKGAHQRPRELISELLNRLKESINRNLRFCSSRDNVYLVFGEKDFLPGLNILKLKDHILIQSNCFFWNKQRPLLELNIKKALKENRIKFSKIHFQIREHEKRESFSSNDQQKTEFVIKEFDIFYKVKLSQFYDIGIYTDMASIRMQLDPYLENCSSLLNLYSYTGAFSLYALKKGVKEVVSVDLSSKYMNWLEDNLALNKDLEGTHTSIILDTNKALELLKSEKKSFDFVVCDPPSFSSNGKNSAQAFRQYPETLLKVGDILTKNGKVLCVLNTHHIPMKKFRNMVEETKIFKIIKSLKPSQDCTPVKNISESQYLKVLLIEKVHK
ncbi:MAG: class I SAM-dependent methyltransferase [Halobacteriovoraceae bacterium]|nr:class I SAM-dependent methyltransferase [Halobacteriovoraceae bacterium]